MAGALAEEKVQTSERKGGKIQKKGSLQIRRQIFHAECGSWQLLAVHYSITLYSARGGRAYLITSSRQIYETGAHHLGRLEKSSRAETNKIKTILP